jgi:hypothetical protein
LPDRSPKAQSDRSSDRARELVFERKPVRNVIRDGAGPRNDASKGRDDAMPVAHQLAHGEQIDFVRARAMI